MFSSNDQCQLHQTSSTADEIMDTDRERVETTKKKRDDGLGQIHRNVALTKVVTFSRQLYLMRITNEKTKIARRLATETRLTCSLQ